VQLSVQQDDEEKNELLAFCDSMYFTELTTTVSILQKRNRNNRRRKHWTMNYNVANAQRDGRSSEYRWRRLFNAATFG